MWYFTRAHFEKNNNLLKKTLGVEAGEVVDLKFSNGYFICPDDGLNDRVHISKITLDKTLFDLFELKKKKIADDFIFCFTQLKSWNLSIKRSFDNRRHFSRFQIAAKLGYFFAAAAYFHNKKIKITRWNDLYNKKRGKERASIERSIKTWLIVFSTKFVRSGRKPILSEAYDFAVSLFKEISPKIQYDYQFKSLDSFVMTKGFYPYSHVLGHGLEDFFQKTLEEVESEDHLKLTQLVHAEVGEPGILIPFDDDPVIKSRCKKIQKISVPDYLYVTKRHIIPLDLKASLDFAKNKPKQVRADNLRLLFMKAGDITQVIFRDITVEGKLIEPRQVQKKQQKRQKKAVTPMSICAAKFGGGDYLSIIAKLWDEGNEITQEQLKKLGLKHKNLGDIVSMFNDMLKRKRN